MDGRELTGFEEIANEATLFHEGLYRREDGGRPRIENLFQSHIQVDSVANLERPFSEEKVKSVVLGMDGAKSSRTEWLLYVVFLRMLGHYKS